ncbi:MAG: tRNA (adenosine(37)-N6)-threonylcarbamoyltransferase complex transferase subunit TsaD [Gemmatimonadales bacterium]|nr:MAG: tRNA (adenosine(37)-N6)-threonylcarbamoyltransferase complex transferase subunit TsaD [Gemmatimonadales bacterium]
MSDPVLLGIETSCDETSAAILAGERHVRSHVILSQDEHTVWGGVVPELAARAHLEAIDGVVARALEEAGTSLSEVDAIAVTAGPGLVGALLVGVSWAKGAALAAECELVPVHHLEGHLFAPVVEDPEARPPFVALLVSGGHTLLLNVPEWGRYELMGRTRDDAAGEAFDKVARLLDLPYPGGPQVERLALEGDPERHRFPRPMLRPRRDPGEPGFLDVSFSGLKTAVATRVDELRQAGTLEEERAHVAAGFQAAAIDVLVSRAEQALEVTGAPKLLVTGGVSANRALREEARRRLGPEVPLLHASIRLSVDNAAMIARAGLFHLRAGRLAPPDLTADPNLPLPGLVEWSGAGPAKVPS